MLLRFYHNHAQVAKLAQRQLKAYKKYLTINATQAIRETPHQIFKEIYSLKYIQRTNSTASELLRKVYYQEKVSAEECSPEIIAVIDAGRACGLEKAEMYKAFDQFVKGLYVSPKC